MGKNCEPNIMSTTEMIAMRTLVVSSYCTSPSPCDVHAHLRRKSKRASGSKHRARFQLMNVTQRALCMLRHQLYYDGGPDISVFDEDGYDIRITYWCVCVCK
jgi:hypothetical protein